MRSDPDAVTRVRLSASDEAEIQEDTVPNRSLVGTIIDGRYVIERALGEGGMGVVYLARHKIIDRRVAIKVMRASLSGDAEHLTRFINEARTASNVGSPHIVESLDFGQLADGSIYFVMEHVDGQTLGALLDRGAIPIPRVISIIKQVARGLEAAHAAGIIHRDLKPDNVMLLPREGKKDFVKILDFGIAKIGGAKLTRTGFVLGTPHYMSPEQAMGDTVDRRSDVYAVGVLLYEMACGRVPFSAPDDMGVIRLHLTVAPPPMSMVAPGVVPPALEAIIRKCLAKKPNDRYASMTDLTAALEEFEHGAVTMQHQAKGASVGAHPPRVEASTSRRATKIEIAIAATLAAVLCVALALIVRHALVAKTRVLP